MRLGLYVYAYINGNWLMIKVFKYIIEAVNSVRTYLQGIILFGHHFLYPTL